MSYSNYKKVFSGNFIEVQMIILKLHANNIKAVVKNESESARLAGFAPSILGLVDILVHKDEITKAETVINEIIISSKN